MKLPNYKRFSELLNNPKFSLVFIISAILIGISTWTLFELDNTREEIIKLEEDRYNISHNIDSSKSLKKDVETLKKYSLQINQQMAKMNDPAKSLKFIFELEKSTDVKLGVLKKLEPQLINTSDKEGKNKDQDITMYGLHYVIPIQGNYGQILNFIYSLQTYPIINKIISLSIEPLINVGYNDKLNAVLEIIFLAQES